MLAVVDPTVVEVFGPMRLVDLWVHVGLVDETADYTLGRLACMRRWMLPLGQVDDHDWQEPAQLSVTDYSFGWFPG